MIELNISEAFTIFISEQFSKGNSQETLYYYNYNIPPFIKFCEAKGKNDVEDLDTNIFEEYKAFLLKTKTDTKKISLQTYCRAVKVFLNWLNEKQLLLQNIGSLKLIKAETKNIVPLSDEEVEMILNCFDTSFYGVRNKLIVLLMVDSGLRRGEVVSLLRQNVNLLNKTMLVQGKGNKERIVPFGEETKRYIKKFINMSSTNGEYLIQKIDGEPISENTIKCFFQDLKKDSGICRLYPHLLRHTFATNYILYGGEVEELRILLGHTSISMTLKYVHLAAQQRIINQRYHSHIDNIMRNRSEMINIQSEYRIANNF